MFFLMRGKTGREVSLSVILGQTNARVFKTK